MWFIKLEFVDDLLCYRVVAIKKCLHLLERIFNVSGKKVKLKCVRQKGQN